MTEIGYNLDFATFWITFYSRHGQDRSVSVKVRIQFNYSLAFGGSLVGGGSCIKQTMHGCLCICGPK